MILARLQCNIEHKLAGFRPGNACCSQVLNITQHIEDGFDDGQITGAAFIDLTAAYYTINHRRFLTKLVMLTDDVPLTKFIRTFLSNRQFKVELNGKQSRWRNQRNGLPQCSVLSPLLFNVYANELGAYYKEICLRPNPEIKDPANCIPSKEPPCRPQTECHMERHEAGPHSLTCLPWHHTRPLTHLPKPMHEDARAKLSSRNNLMGKLRGTNWGPCPPHHEDGGDRTMSLRGRVGPIADLTGLVPHITSSLTQL